LTSQSERNTTPFFFFDRTGHNYGEMVWGNGIVESTSRYQSLTILAVAGEKIHRQHKHQEEASYDQLRSKKNQRFETAAVKELRGEKATVDNPKA